MHAAFVPEIDSDHRELYRIGDELEQALAKGAAPERVNTLVEALITGFEHHFTHEERLMRSSHYPIYAWHKQQHDGVRRRLKQFAGSLQAGERDTPQMLAEYLAEWTKDHVGLTDRMFGAYLRNHERLQAVAS